jgi:hypothetical protein
VRYLAEKEQRQLKQGIADVTVIINVRVNPTVFRGTSPSIGGRLFKADFVVPVEKRPGYWIKPV